MSIMDMFRPKPPEAAPPAAGPNSQNQNPIVPNANTPQNKDGTGPKAIPESGKGDQSPLDGYGKLWETDPNAPKKPDTNVTFKADPKAFQDAASKLNFAEVIPADLAEKALKGDASSFAQAINLATQAVYAQGAGATTKLIEAALAKQSEMFQTHIIPDLVRQVTSRNVSAADNPLLSNPAIKPFADLLQAQVMAKNPQASPTEISKYVNDAMSAFSTELAKSYGFEVGAKKEVTADTAAVNGRREETDWGKFLEAPSN